MRLSSGQQELVRWLAIAAMVVDHIGLALFPGEVGWRLIGRFAWPLFAFLLAYNLVVRRVDAARYVVPLATWGLVALAPHWTLGGVRDLNILFTLLLSVCVWLVMDWARRGAPLWAVGLSIAYLMALSSVVEYGAFGVLLPLVIAYALDVGRWAWLLPVAVAAVVNGGAVWAVPAVAALGVPAVVAALAVKVPRTGVVPYVVYPVHLAVLVALVRL